MNTRKNSGKYMYVVLVCGFLLNFAANYPQYQLAPIAHLLMPQLDMTVSQFSSLFSSTLIPGILLGIGAGILCDKFGVKKCVSIAGAISLVAIIARIFVQNYIGMFICMVFSGIVMVFFNANISKIIGAWFPPEKIGTAVGIALAGSNCAMAVGMGTTAMLPSVKIAFTIAAIVSAAAFVVWVIFMKDKQPDAAAMADAPGGVSATEGLKSVAKNRGVWIVGICAGLMMTAAMCISTFLPQALQTSKGMDAVAAGALSSVITVGNIFGSILGPLICVKMGKTRPYLFLFSVFVAVGTAFAWLAPAGAPIIICFFMTGFVTSATIAQLMSLPVLLPGVGSQLAGAAGGFVGTIQLILGVVLPSYIISPITGDNFMMLYLIAGALVLVGAFVSLMLPEIFGRRSNS